jgi:DNA repair protein RecN (Recombination protein N)
MDNNVLDANAKGIDTIEFFLSANLGEPVKPLATIASGGEISRIMLAIKTVFQDLDPVQTLVFDEIDSGISGKAAEKVAEQLVKLSKSKQVFCITHLSQIARSADHHLHIVKSVKNGQTFVEANYLNELESPKLILELFTGMEIEGV